MLSSLAAAQHPMLNRGIVDPCCVVQQSKYDALQHWCKQNALSTADVGHAVCDLQFTTVGQQQQFDPTEPA